MNNALNSYVTRVSFNLSLSSNQIASLVGLNEQTKDNCNPNNIKTFITCGKELIDRGLVTHDRVKYWQITKAGKLVIELLKEAGLYNQYKPAKFRKVS